MRVRLKGLVMMLVVVGEEEGVRLSQSLRIPRLNANLPLTELSLTQQQ